MSTITSNTRRLVTSALLAATLFGGLAVSQATTTAKAADRYARKHSYEHGYRFHRCGNTDRPFAETEGTYHLDTTWDSALSCLIQNERMYNGLKELHGDWNLTRTAYDLVWYDTAGVSPNIRGLAWGDGYCGSGECLVRATVASGGVDDDGNEVRRTPQQALDYLVAHDARVINAPDNLVDDIGVVARDGSWDRSNDRGLHRSFTFAILTGSH